LRVRDKESIVLNRGFIYIGLAWAFVARFFIQTGSENTLLNLQGSFRLLFILFKGIHELSTTFVHAVRWIFENFRSTGYGEW